MINKNKAILGALALDLKRVALGYQRGSNIVAGRFFEEALKRRKELDSKTLKPHINKFLSEIDKLKNQKSRTAEDALMYSTIFLNASR